MAIWQLNLLLMATSCYIMFYTLCIGLFPLGVLIFSNMSNRIIDTPPIEIGIMVISFISSISAENTLRTNDTAMSRAETAKLMNE